MHVSMHGGETPQTPSIFFSVYVIMHIHIMVSRAYKM